jgi:hypothetical protein
VFNGDVTLELLRNTRFEATARCPRPKIYGAPITSIYPINYSEEIIVNIVKRHYKCNHISYKTKRTKTTMVHYIELN